MNREGAPPPVLPLQVRETLDDFRSQLDLELRVWSLGEDGRLDPGPRPPTDNTRRFCLS